MPLVRFVDGPCAPDTRAFTDAQVADLTVSCGGKTYHLVAGSTDHYLAWVNLPASVADPVAEAPQAAHAWRRLVHSLVTETPRDLRRASAAGRHMARIGRRA